MNWDLLVGILVLANVGKFLKMVESYFNDSHLFFFLQNAEPVSSIQFIVSDPCRCNGIDSVKNSRLIKVIIT